MCILQILYEVVAQEKDCLTASMERRNDGCTVTTDNIDKGQKKRDVPFCILVAISETAKSGL